MTIDDLKGLHNKKFNVLGSKWTIKVVDSEKECYEYRTLRDQDANALTQIYLREIWINADCFETKEDSQVMPDDNPAINQDLTHEIYHAFFAESGLDMCTGTSGCENGWARNETMVDWNAKMFPKILKARRDLGISDEN